MFDGVTSVDGRLAVWMGTHRYGPLNDVFVWLGSIERIGAVWMVLAIFVAFARWRRGLPAVAAAALTGLTTFAADAITFAVKDLVDRPRPFVVHPQIQPLYAVHSSSFPSGHAATAFAGAVLVSFLGPRGTPFFMALAVVMAFARVYVGVHYPGDVIAGAAIGAAVGLLIAMLARFGQRRRRHVVEHVQHPPGQVARDG